MRDGGKPDYRAPGRRQQAFWHAGAELPTASITDTRRLQGPTRRACRPTGQGAQKVQARVIFNPSGNQFARGFRKRE